jgi:hypothetical protein
LPATPQWHEVDISPPGEDEVEALVGRSICQSASPSYKFQRPLAATPHSHSHGLGDSVKNSLPTRAPTRAPCRRTSAIATSSTPCATPNCRPRASRTSGATDADCPIFAKKVSSGATDADCPIFAKKVVLTKRIRWFEDSTGSRAGRTSRLTNHAGTATRHGA